MSRSMIPLGSWRPWDVTGLFSTETQITGVDVDELWVCHQIGAVDASVAGGSMNDIAGDRVVGVGLVSEVVAHQKATSLWAMMLSARTMLVALGLSNPMPVPVPTKRCSGW